MKGQDQELLEGASATDQTMSSDQPTAASSPSPPPLVFAGPLQQNGGAWTVDSEANRFYPDGGHVLVPGAGEPISYIASGDAGCAETTRDAFLTAYEGDRIVVISGEGEYDVGDSHPISLIGSWTVTDETCAPDR